MLGIYQRIEAYMTWNLLSYCNDKVFQENHLFKYWLKKVSWDSNTLSDNKLYIFATVL